MPADSPLSSEAAKTPGRTPGELGTRVRRAVPAATGKVLRQGMHMLGHGGDTLPGLVVERLFPLYLPATLRRLPHGVVIVTGTNGKTTTTKLIASVLGQRYRVVTNSSGSNFVRGTISAITKDASWNGELDADIAVFEMDEAHALRLAKQYAPEHVVLLNVSQDQSDRWGSVDTVADLLGALGRSATKSVTVNANCPRLASRTKDFSAPVQWFAVADALQDEFPCDPGGPALRVPAAAAAAVLESYDQASGVARIRMGDEVRDVPLQTHGLHNAQNAVTAAAVGLGAGLSPDEVCAGLAAAEPAFARGQEYRIDGRNVRLHLVKNPAGFRQSLTAGLAEQPARAAILINNAPSDGRDVSWLWDVDVAPLATAGIPITAGGPRALEVTQRLSEAGITVGAHSTEIIPVVEEAIAATPEGERLAIFANYTPMWALHRHLTERDRDEPVRATTAPAKPRMRFGQLAPTLAGKLARVGLRTTGRGGDALPGLIVETLFPKYLTRTLQRLPHGVILVTGTNGKTTTTKFLTTMLGQRYRVVTNASGSNFVRGIINALVEHSSWSGDTQADIAVFEMDEAHSKHFIKLYQPDHSVLLNLSADQVDRFTGVDEVAEYVSRMAEATTKTVIVNADDPRLAAAAERFSAEVRWFGVSDDLREQFPVDPGAPEVHVPREDVSAELLSYDLHTAVARMRIGEKVRNVWLKTHGVYNAQNATAAAAVGLALGFTVKEITWGLSNTEPAFGRGEAYSIDGREVRLHMIKNIAGFRQSLQAGMLEEPERAMLLMNDEDCDGPDVSWVWDTDITQLAEAGIPVDAGGSRSELSSRRLRAAGIEPAMEDNSVMPLIERAIAATPEGGKLAIFANYTCVWEAYPQLDKRNQAA